MTKKEQHQAAKDKADQARRLWRMADGEGKPESVILELKQRADEAYLAQHRAFNEYMNSDES